MVNFFQKNLRERELYFEDIIIYYNVQQGVVITTIYISLYLYEDCKLKDLWIGFHCLSGSNFR